MAKVNCMGFEMGKLHDYRVIVHRYFLCVVIFFSAEIGNKLCNYGSVLKFMLGIVETATVSFHLAPDNPSRPYSQRLGLAATIY